MAARNRATWTDRRAARPSEPEVDERVIGPAAICMIDATSSAASAAVAAASASQPRGLDSHETVAMRGRDDRRRSDRAGDEREPDLGVRNHAIVEGLDARRGRLPPWRRDTTTASGSVSARKNTQPTITTTSRYAWRSGVRAAAGPNAGEAQSFRDEERAVKQAPDDEVPARAVPQAAQEEHVTRLRYMPRRADAVAAERDVEVVAEPRSTARCASAARTPGRVSAMYGQRKFSGKRKPNIRPRPIAMSE